MNLSQVDNQWIEILVSVFIFSLSLKGMITTLLRIKLFEKKLNTI